MKGQMLKNRYAISDELGSGGMATVYRAFDILTHKEVALKHFPKATDVTRIERASFEKELASLKRMDHPNVIKLLDHGTDTSGRPFLVLELLDQDLAHYRDNRSTTAFAGYDDYFEQIGYPVLNALEYAHGMHITHRDVKPRNILIGKDGIVKLADFGIARLKGQLSGMQTLRHFESRPFGPPELDDGAFSHARDVFSFAALTLWALAPTAIVDYEQLYSALEKVDVHPKIKAILSKCLDRSPENRFENAILLKMEVDRFLQNRRTSKPAPKRPLAKIVFTERAKKEAKELLEVGVNEIEQILSDDIRDAPTVSEWMSSGKTVSNEFAVLGSRYCYRIFFKQKNEPFFLLSIHSLSPAVIQHRKESQPELPIDFSFRSLGVFIEPIDALDQIESSILEKKKTEKQSEKHPLIKAWEGVLSAKRDIEQRRTPAIGYSNLRINQGRVYATVVNPTSLEPGTRWTVKSGRHVVTLEVSHLNGNEVVFFLRSASDNHPLPTSGELRFDIAATELCLDRQEEALGRLAQKQTANSRLLDILSDPTSVASSQTSDYEISFDPMVLDISKQEAIIAALSCEDLLLIHGPPGTGKTKLIAHLIDTINHQLTKPGHSSSILLVSQTHVAIDNALEKVAEINPTLRLLRISTSGDVAKSVKGFLYEEQSQKWKQEVRVGGEQWIESFAERIGVKSSNVRKGCKLLELAAVVEELQTLEKTIADFQFQIETNDYDYLEDRMLPEDLQGHRDQLPSLKSRRSHLQEDHRTLRLQVSEAVGETEQEVEKWDTLQLRSLAEDFLGESASHKTVKSLIEVHNDWIMRFGRDRSFNSAICERSDVVAGTCIGFMGLKDIDDVEFDWCIVDEASKATILESLVPMVRAKKWVLVGDSKQLPPFGEFSSQFAEVCDSLGVNKDDLSKSLFTELEKVLPEEKQRILRHQYRMCKPIAKMVADCFYPNQLEPGDLTPTPELMACFGAPMIWLDTSGFANRFERSFGNSYTNECEVELIMEKLKQVLNSWDFTVKNSRVLLLSPYTAQVTALRKAANTRFNDTELSFIEASTIDAVQGRQAKVVFLSLTRNEPNSFVDDPHRINVAISRAEDLLVIVGNEQSVRESVSCKNLKRVLASLVDSGKDFRIVRYMFGGEVR